MTTTWCWCKPFTSFHPRFDDPYLFGQIAAANSLSDVYAMGGRPITALSIVGFPVHALPEETFRQILRGGVDKMTEAGVPVVGGHSIDDPQIKAGFAVTGLVRPDKAVTNAGVVAGDRLILTKPLGTGILAFAAQIGRALPCAIEAAGRSMARLNRTAARLMIECGADACTDVTGFGLAGHLAAMAAASKVDVEIVWDDLPLLPGVVECLAEAIASGVLERNRESTGDRLCADENVQPGMLDLCFDPQTSGGLIIALPEAAADDLLARLHAAGIHEAAVIGRAVGPGSGRVRLRAAGRRPILAASQSVASRKNHPTIEEKPKMSCCEGNENSSPLPTNLRSVPGEGQGVRASTETARESERQFHDFSQAAAAPGALDGKTKRAIAIALSVMARCEPCVKSHIQKAREMGFSQEQIDEAAWVAISFGGSPAMVFYNGVRKA